jgi:hypothetical protein
MGTETMKEDLMIIMVNSLVADHSLIDIANREKPPTRYHCSQLFVKDQLIMITSMITVMI